MHQEFGEIISSLDISIIEITIIFFISLIGSITHEYISIIKNINKLNRLEILISIISSTIIITIVCISINPLIVKISPRLILLPPLILSLTGSELIIYLTGFKSSAKLIEYILSFFNINRSKDNIQDVTEIDGVLNPDQKNIQKEKEPEKDEKEEVEDSDDDDDDEENNISKQDEEDLINEIKETYIYLLNLKEKYDNQELSNHDFIWNFMKVEESIENIKFKILEIKAVNPIILLKFTDIIRLQADLNVIFKQIMDMTKD